LEDEARAAMAAEDMAADRITTTRAFGMRYVGQSWDLTVPLSGRLREAGDVAPLFHAAHEHRFGYRTEDPVEIVSLRVSAFGRVDKPDLPDGPAGGTVEAARKAGQGAYDRDRLPVGGRIAGPATIEEMGAVTVLPAGWAAEVGRYGELHLRRDAP
jgi:N-methylhydantoinase A